MAKEKKERRILALTGVAAIAAIALNLLITAISAQRNKKKKRDLPGSNVLVNLSASEIFKLADRIISKSKEVHDAVASVPPDKATYANTILRLAELEAQQLPLVQSCVLPKMVSVSDDIRKASAEAERRIDAHVLVCSNREDVYRVIKTFAARGDSINHEAKCYIQCLVRDFERNGMNLTLTKREEARRLKTRIDELSIQYIQNLSEDDSFVLFSEIELDGMPPKFIKSLDKAENNKLKITLRRHHVSPVLEYCKVGTTRKRVAVAYGQRCGKATLPIVENLVQLRHKLARLLGYSNYADYVVERRMAKTSSKVFEFLEHISVQLTDLATKELSALKDLKEKEEGDTPFGTEDLLYYLKRAEEQECYVDFVDINQYFPLDLVLSGIFKIFQDLFGLRFDEIRDVEAWHSDVRLFSAWDLSSNELLGYFYLDMYSREEKFGYSCVLALQNGSTFFDGARQVPVTLLLCQFRKEADGNPELLRFSEVVNLFHELGHVVYHICNRASYARFSSLHVDPDFLEIPSQVLENWCYESSTLKLISGFHQDITKPITDEMCASLKRRRDSFSALKIKLEILHCLFDQIMHSTENVDALELLKHLHPKVMLGLPMLEGTNPASCIPRFAIGYDAACYSRIWSEVFAADIFASKFQEGLSNYAGLQFRSKVLAPGGAKEPLELLSDFLGREPSVEAYIKRKARNSL
ncbi:Mitochondrial intermediate peptidase protein [Thalictrum thalictroides]|uniref:Mitochondrial intermediate peptidase protein n=1 Tax=Thalictrum thalictroides TaxID=46969 RepID=A0A7J6WUQ9_THATH|nr:Mitochondrial intermediate peptidase protein [Thalictrum thalictroides]